MAIIRFSNDSEGAAAAEAVQEPKHVWVTPGNPGRILVFTDQNVPTLVGNIADIEVSRFQLIRALAMAGKTGATATAVAGMSVQRQTLWAEANEFRRSDKFINALKLGLPGINNQDMDNIFIAASAIDPSQV